jgi:anti-sigma factor RsiW
MNDNMHITENDLYAFRHNTIAPEERKAFLEHIGSCTFCSDQFAAFMSDNIIAAPRDLKANIMKAVRHEQLIKGKVKEASKRMQLLIYSLKVGAATTVALLLLLLTVNISDMTIRYDMIPKKEPDTASQKVNTPITLVIRDGMDAICNNIIDFSNNIIK